MLTNTMSNNATRKSLVNSIYAHAQDFAMSDDLLLAILKASVPQQVNKQQAMGFDVFTYTRHI
jgi:hypothetical protein